MVRERLYTVRLKRKAQPGFGHTDHVSFGFRLTLSLCQELCRVSSAIRGGVRAMRPRQVEQVIQLQYD